MDEFYRMCDDFHWWGEDPRKLAARQLFKDALTKQFNAIYGTNVDDINSWQKLCQILDITPIPDDLDDCRNVSDCNR